MFIAPKTINAPAGPSAQYWPKTDTTLNGGLNLVDREWKLSDGQTPKVLNLWWKNGELGKRWGQDFLLSTEEPETVTYATYKFPFKSYIIKHTGTKLYKQNMTTGATTALYTVNASKGVFFKFNGKLYYKQPGLYLEISESLVASVVVPYIPTVIINRTYSGGGDTNEQYNRLGAGFINAFVTDGSHASYPLTDTVLDATALVASSDGGATWPLIENTDFTVDRATGIVTFVSTPTAGTNVYKVKGFKTNQADIDAILNSLYVIPFGGQNDNRVFIGGGNGGYYYWTGITTAGADPTYFAYNNYNIIGLTDETINGFGKQYDTLCIFKDREIYGTTYTWDGTKGVFNTFPINSQVGCDCPDSIQNVNNYLVWLTTYAGIYTMVGTAVQNQRKVFNISRNINPRLLTETTLKTASSVDFDGKYWLCVGDKVYLWDYFISPYVDTGNPDESARILSWWYFDTINAGSWVIDGLQLYYVNRATGKTVMFHETYDNDQFYDFGAAITSMYRYPLRKMGGGIYEFTVSDGILGIRGDTLSSHTVQYFTSDDPYGDPSIETVDAGTFGWDTFAWDLFYWGVTYPEYPAELMPGAKNVRLFGAEFSNSEPGVDMNMSSVIWEYKLTKKI
ncbi:MAG: hypothetical protein LLG05_18750 [Porphyromonadaceae bacterium]|nr:hypothetical protein [Porphyromonadaceae bacterium]